ncbi:FkbM family methyltransferase [Pedobacter duraquae]|uniref:FkbM family methyltransferase n=1 Tax=Pedobacter duraquae TaxID=425511 RepID=A0A4R6IM46_9SPHI|nr:FkbM family methyltransferase [Pedobacter duraquae]TDO23141.1 FkbM family methyltransferase [Pedobacter duraquae]
MNIKNIPAKIYKKVFRVSELDKVVPAKDQRMLKKLDRYQPATFSFLKKSFTVVDADTFLGSYHEIFIDEIYNFESHTPSPLIIDCGANIGLATIYFKLKYPNAQIIAFEPDPNIYAALSANVRSFGFKDVNCENKAVSDVDAMLDFWLEGGHSGKVVAHTANHTSSQVKAVRLKTILQEHEKIEFLKIDIEGHETALIPDLAEELNRVEFLFLEYHSFMDGEQTLDTILAHLKRAGFRYYIQQAYPKKFPFINREIFYDMDFMCNIFCYRV